MSVPSRSAQASLIARDVSRSFGDRAVLDGVDLVANPGEPVGLVGENGAGKSTLMRLLAGVDEPDAGSISRPEDVAYLGQEPDFTAGATIGHVLAEVLAPLHESVSRLEVLASELGSGDPSVEQEYAGQLAWAEAHDAWGADRRADLAAAHLGLRHLDRTRSVDTLSGGERTRLALAAIITRRPDCVLLDEPTNHLDDEAMAFVEDFVVSCAGVVVVASHDRVFLDNTAAVIVDLDPSHFGVDGEGGTRFAGDFTAYLAERRKARRRWEAAFLAQRDELRALRLAEKTTARTVAHDRGPRDNDKYIYGFKGANVARTVARRVHNVERRIEAIERAEIPKPPRPLSFGGTLAAGSATVWVRALVVPGRVAVERLTVDVGHHVLVTGPNGSGKSSLLAVLEGQLRPADGDVQVRAKRVGYLPQDVIFARPDISAREAYAAAVGSEDAAPLGELGLVHPRELGKPVGVLSVGQQRRLALAVVVASQPDLLLLDEPTNHISLALAADLEEALGRSPGAVVVTSHDRWLRRRWSGPVLPLP